MNLLETIKLKLESNDRSVKTSDVNCPNCWGVQEYSNVFYETIRTEEANTNNVLKRKGWIQAYTEQHITGIQSHAM
jgi:hypothetical protein